MRILEEELRNKTIDFIELLKYGFTQENEIYSYHRKIYDEQFEMNVTVANNKMTAKLFDLSTNEEYILVDIQASTGDFVGKLREEYQNELQSIITKCTIPNVFKSKQAKEIIKYIKEKYNDNLEFLWKKFPENAVWRNKKNKKWYAILLVISERKLGLDSDKIIDILDLRYEKDKIKEIIDNDKIFAGYHMNKDSWITIRLDGSVKTKKILQLIDNSYNISLTK